MLLSCQSSNKEKPSVKDYLYPKDSLKTAKLFTFKRTDDPEIKMQNIQHCFTKNNTSYHVKYSLDRSQRDSTLFKEINGRFDMVERYMVFPNGSEMILSTSKANIIEYINDDTQTKSIIEFEDAMHEIVIRIEGLSLVDSSSFEYGYQGKKINCIRYIETTTVTTTSKVNPGVQQSFEIEGESIYGENLGMIAFITKNKRNGEIESWELESIMAFTE